MEIGFCFEVVGDFQSDTLWKEIKFANVNLLDIERVFVYGQATLSILMELIIICCNYGTITGGEFVCE